jgi:leader peptidase (prepilin peptidase)/N-methyltransferase
MAGLFGLMVGSFLNVVIHRLPRMMQASMEQEAREILQPEGAPETSPRGSQPPFNLVTPRSRCPACKTPIFARHNVPLLSWLWLRGRCAACRAPVSVRYPLVELLTGLLFAVVAWTFGGTPETALALLVTAFLVALAAIDFDTQYLPDSLTLPLLWLGLLAAVLFGRGAAPLPVAPAEAITGALLGYLSLWSVYWVFRLITGREGMGYGDFKLLAALGAWLGWTAIPLIILLSAVVGALVGGALILFRGRDHQLPMPFGPFLAAAGWVALLWGPALVDGYRSVSGL